MDIVGDKPENLAKPSKHKVIGYNAPIEPGKPPPPPLAVAYGRILFPPTRIEEGDTITYHHHPLRLLQTAGPAAGTLLLYIIVLVLLRVVLPSVFSVITAWPFSLVAALVAVALIGWVIWFYEDWRNDIFLLTSKKIVDVDRAPFGFGKTQQREASLDAVQNVTSKKNGFLETQLDMGSVVVKTGGAEGDLIFNQAADPRGIQRDIAYKMSLLNAGKRSKEVEDELSKMSKWLGIYDEMARLEYGRKKDLK